MQELFTTVIQLNEVQSLESLIQPPCIERKSVIKSVRKSVRKYVPSVYKQYITRASDDQSGMQECSSATAAIMLQTDINVVECNVESSAVSTTWHI